MDFYMQDGVIIRQAEDGTKKKGKKGSGVSAVLGLMQELITFQEKVDATVEAQDITENRTKITEHAKALEGMYKSLSEIAAGGVRAMGQSVAQPNMDEEPQPEMTNPQDKDTSTVPPRMPLSPAAPVQ